jgi:flagellar assembly protein FliH
MPLIMNDSVDSNEEEEFKTGSEDIDIKPWDLPYWRGAPKTDKANAAQQALEEEKEEHVEVVEPLTVEELEAIRNEGYEEGFLQGLNEGREKGELEGKEQGLIAGKEEGNKQGRQEGNRIGFEAGQAEGLVAGKDEITTAAEKLAQLALQLEQSLKEKDAALPQVLSQLIKTACETIIERELEQGDNQITQKVIAALDQLPDGAENIKIFVSPKDALQLEHGLSNSGRELHFDIDDSLPTGSARIKSKQSLVEFSHEERMQKVFELIDAQCEKLDLNDIAGEEELIPTDSVEVTGNNETVENEEAVENKEAAADDKLEESDNALQEDHIEEDQTQEDKIQPDQARQDDPL